MTNARPAGEVALVKQWFYSAGGQQYGPVAEQDLMRMLDARELPEGTLVWREGLTEWTEARKADAFAPTPYAAPASDPLTDVDWDGCLPSGSQSRPWVRYWARTMDFLVFSLLVGFALGMFAPEWVEMPGMAFELLLLFAYNFVEPAVFAVWGNTPMKALLRIRIRNAAGGKLTYPEALRRVFNVWVRGQGMGIPLVSLFTLITAYSHLSNHRITTWDAAGGYQVSHRKIEWWRWLLMVSIILGLTGLMIYGSIDA